MLLLGNMLWRTTGAGQAPQPPQPPPPDEPVRPSGGYPAFEGDRRRSREEISRARARFGLRDEVAEAIAAVAQRQAEAEAAAAANAAERAAVDEQKRFDELFRELELRSVAFEAQHLEALATMREEFIARIRKQQQEEEELMLLMLVAAAAAM